MHSANSMGVLLSRVDHNWQVISGGSNKPIDLLAPKVMRHTF